MKKRYLARMLALLLCLVMLFLTGCSDGELDLGSIFGKDSVSETDDDDERASKRKKKDKDAEEDEEDEDEDTGNYKETIYLYGVSSNLISYEFDGASSARSQLMTHDRLVEKDYANGDFLEIIPGLATEWEWINDTTLEMNLREGVQFHNGEPFTADDVVFTFNECVLTSYHASKLAMLDHVEVVDDYTVRLILKYHHSDFLYLLSEAICSIVNREAVEANEDNGALIGTGPYRIVEFVQSDYETLERNDDYWGKKGRTKYFCFRNIPETSTARLALQNGEMDAVSIDTADIESIMSYLDLDYRIYSNLILYVCFNTTKGPGTDENFRKAVAYAINKTDFLAAVDTGYSQSLNTLWSPNSFGYDDSIQDYGHNLELAKQYLAKSQYKEFTLTINSSLSYIGEILQANCADIGLTVNLETLDSAALSAKTKFDVAEHEAYLGTYSMNMHGDDCRRLFYPGSNVNKAVVTDERIIELIDAAAQEKDEAKRIEMYHEIQQINHDEAYYLPLCLACETTAYYSRLKGVNFEPRGRHQWTYAYIEE